MQIEVLISKIRVATVTKADLEYDRGSITLDPDFMDQAGLHEWQRVDVNNKTTGFRGNTYILAGERGKKEVCANGALAYHIHKGDKIHINAYGMVDKMEIYGHIPIFVEEI
jgi:aspartate 1-decarboxylase